MRDYARAWRWAALLGIITLWLGACAKREIEPPAVALPPIARVSLPADWRPGDRWVYDWISGSATGTKTVEVLEIKEVNEVRYYVVAVGDMEHYYTLDFSWSGSVRDSKVQARMVPPQPWFVWPLEVGRRWGHRGVYEAKEEKKEQDDAFAVVAAETVEVPAGRFPTLKVVREASNRDTDEYWYSPEVRWYVKWIGRRGKVKFEEWLREYHRAPHLIPESAPIKPPSKAK